MVSVAQYTHTGTHTGGASPDAWRKARPARAPGGRLDDLLIKCELHVSPEAASPASSVGTLQRPHPRSAPRPPPPASRCIFCTAPWEGAGSRVSAPATGACAHPASRPQLPPLRGAWGEAASAPTRPPDPPRSPPTSVLPAKHRTRLCPSRASLGHQLTPEVA